jgi:hypothetical protein
MARAARMGVPGLAVAALAVSLFVDVGIARADDVPRGAIQVNVAPAAATVRLDGVRRGTGSMRLAQLPAGAHNVGLSLDGYTPVERVVQVDAGQTGCLSVTLGRAPLAQPDPSDVRAQQAGAGITAGVLSGIATSAAGRPPLETEADPRGPVELPVLPPASPPVASGPPPWEIAAPCP